MDASTLSPHSSLLSFLAIAAGVAVVVSAFTVVADYDPWLLLPVTVLGLAIVTAGVAARTERRWVHRTKWALLLLAAVGFIGRLTSAI